MFPKLLKRHEVEKVTLLGRASIYRLIALGAFSRPIRLCRSALAWRATDILCLARCSRVLAFLGPSTATALPEWWPLSLPAARWPRASRSANGRTLDWCSKPRPRRSGP